MTRTLVLQERKIKANRAHLRRFRRNELVDKTLMYGHGFADEIDDLFYFFGSGFLTYLKGLTGSAETRSDHNVRLRKVTEAVDELDLLTEHEEIKHNWIEEWSQTDMSRQYDEEEAFLYVLGPALRGPIGYEELYSERLTEFLYHRNGRARSGIIFATVVASAYSMAFNRILLPVGIVTAMTIMGYLGYVKSEVPTSYAGLLEKASRTDTFLREYGI